MRHDIVTDAQQLRDLEGQQYVVLRPSGAVMREFESEKDALTLHLGDGVRYPGAAHVTLRGFSEPSRADEVREVIRRWAAQQHPVDVVFEAVDAFPAPWQIVIARLSRTSSLLGAYSSLTDALDATDLRRIGELPLEEWVFHLSIAYADALDPVAWRRVASRARRELPEPPAETITDVELVTYSGATEHREVFPLGTQ